MTKKEIRKNFRDTCFNRDKYSCVTCDFKADSSKEIEDQLDCHHITDRHLMPNGGYVKENGITLCSDCHIKAEQFHITGVYLDGFSPEDLYRKINSSYDKAYEKSLLLKGN